MAGSPKFDFGAFIRRGRRTHNEDWLGHYVSPDPRLRAVKGAIFVVADGLGGHIGGQVASRLGVDAIIYEYYRDLQPGVANSLEWAIGRANWWIHEQGRRHPAYLGMATTVVAAVLQDDQLCLAHVGDSRAYLVRGPQIWQLTRDHTWVSHAVARGILTSTQALRHPWRKIITRALGLRARVDVDAYRFHLNPADILLLCTDGLSDFVASAEMCQALRKYQSQKAAIALADLAWRRGSDDNITALVIRVNPATRPAPALSHRPPYSATWKTASSGATMTAQADWRSLFLLVLTLAAGAWAILITMVLVAVK